MTFVAWWQDYINQPGRNDLRFNAQAETAALDAWEAAQAAHLPTGWPQEELRQRCDALQEQVAELTEEIGAGEGKNQMRTVDELTPEALARAIAAYEKAHNTKPDFGFAPDRAWMEGYSTHAASQDAEDAARYRWLRDVGDETWTPLRERPEFSEKAIDDARAKQEHKQ